MRVRRSYTSGGVSSAGSGSSARTCGPFWMSFSSAAFRSANDRGIQLSDQGANFHLQRILAAGRGLADQHGAHQQQRSGHKSSSADLSYHTIVLRFEVRRKLFAIACVQAVRAGILAIGTPIA